MNGPEGAHGLRPHLRLAVLQQWYRGWLRAQIPPLLAKWETKIGVTVTEVRVKRMKTRWGSCNAAARRIWLNLESAKKPFSCLEYIFVHELVHSPARSMPMTCAMMRETSAGV